MKETLLNEVYLADEAIWDSLPQMQYFNLFRKWLLTITGFQGETDI